MNDYIFIQGAKTNNLADLSIKIPKGKMTVVVGVSGSGKSSLVFDTIASESQRLLNETYSSYIQQLLPHFPRATVDKITNLPVSIVISQEKIGRNIRSTVGTITDIYTNLRLLFSRIAKSFVGYSMVYSFNHPQGMCKTCQGLGQIQRINVEKLIDFDLSLIEGAIKFPTFQPGGWRLTRYTESGYFNNNKKIKDYSKKELTKLLYDAGSKPPHPTEKWHKTAIYKGIIPRITESFVEKEKHHYKKQLNRILDISICPDCKGSRLNEKIRSAKINGKSIAACVEMPIIDLLEFMESIETPKAQIVLNHLIQQLKNLKAMGLSYLSLNRPTKSLSGGESQRIKIARHVNSSLNDVLYIFDEPSIGLHPKDLEGIIHIFKELKAKGNTIIIVDHDPQVIKSSEHIIEIGPGAAENGGQIIFEGTYQKLIKTNTKTAQALTQKLPVPYKKRIHSNFYTLNQVSLHNIKNVSVKIPKNVLTVVTGVAGSGKSTLIRYLFKKKYSQANILDQGKITGNHRSNILTYLGIFDLIRNIFSKVSGKSKSLFSYNSKGACPTCQGKGYVTIDLAFMGNVKQICEDCNGKRYNKEALSVLWKGYHMNDILRMNALQALALFENKTIKNVLQHIIDVNLGYIPLGQSLDTYSGGELQRLKIAKVLQKNSSQVLILDEPTTGLHENDSDKLLKLFQKLLTRGKTLIVIEHNLKIISQADWVIDMGPFGGKRGGKVLFQGQLFDFLKCQESFTASYLRKYLEI